jgi:predicted phage terminase large subunit-like protein
MAFKRDLSDAGAMQDAFDAVRLLGDTDMELAQEWNRKIRSMSGRYAIEQGSAKMFDINQKSLLFAAPYDFDCFMLALERNRPVKERFWQPRRKHLMPVCRALQEMEDGKLDELFLSCPPRIGKSTLMMMFFLWVMGRNSERSNLYCSYTDSVVGVLYSGILEVLNDKVTYAYRDIFPTTSVASTNAKDLLINLDRKKRYASFTGRSLYGTLNGACDCNGYLVGDDLISGIEEAMNKDRLAGAWLKVDNNMLPRAKETAKVLWIGTRWSLVDPQGVRIDLLENDPKYADRRWRVLNTPALNDEDESNFDYDYGVGFSSDYYHQRRASFERNNDMASWMAQYQGQPIERDGAVFAPEQLRYYNGVLPEGDPDRVFMAVDPAWGGGDFTAAPVVYQFGDDLYVADVVYDNGEKNVTQPLIVDAVKRYGVQAVKVEGTKMTASYGEDIDRMLRNDGIRVNMQINTKHFTGNGKRQRIFDKAPEIRERMVFLNDGKRSKAYQMFMTSMFAFTVTGKAAKHDDAADACSMVCDMAFRFTNKVEVFSRPF